MISFFIDMYRIASFCRTFMPVEFIKTKNHQPCPTPHQQNQSTPKAIKSTSSTS